METSSPLDPPGASGSNGMGRRDLARLVATVVGLTALLRLPACFVDVFNSDEPFLATQAQVIRHGGDLYRQAADRKPPLVPSLYAGTFALTGTTALWTVRVVAMLAVVATALLLASEARRRYGRRAMWLVAVLSVVATVALAPQDGQAANFEIFMLPFTVAAVVLARRDRLVGAGLAVALATLAKQTGAAMLLPVWWLAWRRNGRRGVGFATLAFAVPLGAAAIVFGPRQLVYWTVLGNGSYVGLSSASAHVVGLFAVMTFAWVACNIPILWTVPRSWRDRRRTSLDGFPDTDLWLWVLGAVVSVAVGLRFFGHYYLQLVPPFALLSAGALSRASTRAVRGTVALSLASGLLFSAAGYFLTPFGGEPRYREVSRFLHDHTRPDDSVFVWGTVPEIYWSADRRPATRYIATASLVAGNHAGRTDTPPPSEIDPQIWRWFFRDLRAHPPKYVVDTTPSGVRGARRSPLSRYPKVQRYVDDHYRLDRRIDGYDVYVRNG